MGACIRDTLLSLRGIQNESATLGKEITQGVELLCFHIASHASVFLMFLYCPEFEGVALIVRTKQITGFVFFNHHEDARNLAQRLNNFS